ncbi:MAG: ATP-binding protein [Gammaproteobacteria bacterium]|nr:ATP-binding protein [Gammaproteobacteria bacterium]
MMGKYHSEDNSGSGSRPGADPLVQLWLLRLLVGVGTFKRSFRDRLHRYSEEELVYSLAEIFDIDMEACRTEDDDIDYKEVLKRLHRLYVNTEKKLKDATAPECLFGNVERLSALAGLSATDCRILEFAVLIHTEDTLEKTGDLHGDLKSKQVFKVLSMALDLPQTEIRKSLSKNGALSRSGLLTLERNSADTLKEKLELLSRSFADIMVSSDGDPVALLRDIVFPSSAPHLAIDDFPHLEKELGVLRPHLRQSLVTGRKGVNILLHGDPGTGKSQLAKILALETGCELFEVASEDEDGDPRMGALRLRALQAAQNILSNHKMMILFDEIEDVFDCGDPWDIGIPFGRVKIRDNPKAWINRRLEENSVPTLWLGNSINGLDPAFIRRFDMIIKMPVPPRRQRQKIIRASCSDLLNERDIDRISAVDALAPAVVTRASAVVKVIGDDLAQTEQMPALELIINNTLEAQGHQRTKRYDPNQLPETYNPEFIHADTDVESIAAGLKKTKAGRLCLYGPSGTGKTAYGRWLAEQLDVPLLVKRGSDLMSMWVGGTEKNIAECFRQAETEGAILLIDEVEGFLQDRRTAKYNWEVTGVNEMLTQMESFPGVFIASTNLVDNLDQASLRRFDLKIKFDFMLPRQSQALLENYCHTLDLDIPDNGLAASLSRLHHLTPGDFAAVMRRRRFMPVCSAAEIMSALEEECSLKENFKRPIGFC